MPEFIPLTSLMITGRAPEHIVALQANGDEVTWAQFSDDVAQVASAVQAMPGADHVLACDDTYHFLVGFMALINAAKNVIIPSNLQPDTLAFIAAKNHSSIIDDLHIHNALAGDRNASLNTLKPEPVFVTAYSSGSTGQPSATIKPIQALEAEVKMLHVRWAAQVKNTIFASSVTHYHAYGLPFQLLWPLCAGEKILLKRITYPEELFHFRNNQNMSFISSPVFLNQHVRLLHDSEPYDFLSFVSSAGAPLPLETAKGMNAALPAPIIEIYGSTETGAIATRTSGGAETWTCLEQVKIKAGENGNLMVCSPYTGQDDFIELGDCGEIENDGRFVLKGRSDRVVKIHQKRISLTELERCCETSPWVGTAKMLLAQNGRLACVAVLTEAGQALLEEEGKRIVIEKLRLHLRTHYDLVVFPRKWRFVEALPVNDMGKTLNADLLALFDKGHE